LVSERLPASNKSLWYAFGPQGETRQLTDSNGNVVDTYIYAAYGLGLSQTGSDVNPFLFGGQSGYYTDGPTGIMLCGARWYDPYIGRWLSRDPIEYEGGDNLYAYCENNPVNGIDPSGLYTGWDLGFITADVFFLDHDIHSHAPAWMVSLDWIFL